MKNILIIFLFLVSNAFSIDFEVKLKIFQEEAIIGEPIYACIEVEYKGEGKEIIAKGRDGFRVVFVMKDIEGKYPKGKEQESLSWLPYNNFEEINKGWKIEKCEDLLGKYIIDKEGRYNIYGYIVSKGPYYEKGSNPNDVKQKEAWEGYIESEKNEITIRIPDGIDKEAYKEFNCGKGCMPLYGEEGRKLLEKYPTSTYAGWVLFSPGTDLEWASGKDLIDDILKPVSERKRWGTFVDEDKGKGYKKSKDYYIKPADEEAREYLEFSEKFLSANPNHINAGIIYARQSLAYMVLGKWEDAYKSGKLSLEKEWPLWIYSHYPPELEKQRKILKEALDEMVKRGFVKDKK